ncbi:MAG: acyl carrier protein [Thiobacillus sp.]|nr:acyl carrier protein [Thiobacillus sp.]
MKLPVEITPDTQPIYEFVIQLLEEKGAVPAPEAVLAYPYLKNGHIDSLAFIKFIFRIEERFVIQFSEADILNVRIRTVGGLIDLIAEKSNQARNA